METKITNEKTEILPWLLLSVTVKMKAEDNTGSDFSARPILHSNLSELWPQASNHLPREKLFKDNRKYLQEL